MFDYRIDNDCTLLPFEIGFLAKFSKKEKPLGPRWFRLLCYFFSVVISMFILPLSCRTDCMIVLSRLI